MDLAYMMDEVMTTNEISLIERDLSQVIADTIAASDLQQAFGAYPAGS